ncbi:MAG TPA: ATP-binding protein [Flavipsychrobacter sp.]
MKIPGLPANEPERLSALYEYNLLDTMPEDAYDNITRIASHICNMPISTITLIDTDRQWHKSRIGLDLESTPRELTFCAHAILQPDPLIVENAHADERFSDTPMVTDAPNIAFYAGVPLLNENGYALGTLCVMDNKPNRLTDSQVQTLRALAAQVVSHFEMRRKNVELAKQKTALENINAELERFAYVVAHDLKSPCNNLMGLAGIMKEMYADNLDAGGIEVLDMMTSAASTLRSFIDGTLNHAKLVNTTSLAKERFLFGDICAQLKSILNIPANVELTYDNGDMQLYVPRNALLQVLINLCVNAIKYNDKGHGHVHLSVTDKGQYYRFHVKDNGPGIPHAEFNRIFDIFSTLGQKDRYNNVGQGIGLSTVKRLVERMDGHITVESALGTGSTFTFTISK